MKKELRILVILIAVLLVGTVGYYFMPKKFGKNVNPSEGRPYKCVRWKYRNWFYYHRFRRYRIYSGEYSRYFNEKRWHFTWKIRIQF